MKPTSMLVVGRVVLGILASTTLALAERGPSWRSWESQAMGNTGVASGDGAQALALNPALLQGQEGLCIDLYTDLGLNGVLLDYADWASDNYQNLNSIDSLLNHIEPVDNKWAPFRQAFVVGGCYNQYALALVGDLRYELTLSKAVLTPVPGAGAEADIFFGAGRGFELPQDYRLGITVRYLYRSQLERQLIGITDPRWIQLYNTLKAKNDGLSTALEKIRVASELAETEQGMGLVLGVARDFDENWTFGASLQDLPAILGGSFLRPQLNLGVNYHRDFGFLEGLVTRLTSNFDWQDFLIPGSPWFKQFKFGVGAKGFIAKEMASGKAEPGTEVFFIGLGQNDGYPTFGVRVGYWLYFSYLYTAEETGTYPGQRPLSFHKLSVDFAI
jgi:hypothetical protein